MQLEKAQRIKAKIKLGLQGPSGSGKTYSALLIAYGLSGDFSKVAVIDTENHSASLYANLGEFHVVNISSPFTPEKYMSAIDVCEKAGMEVIIIDSISHEWENLLDYQSSLQGNSYGNWSKVTPRHNAFVQTILQSQCHVISTMRTKQDYVLSEKNGKMVPEKVGLKSIQRDGLEYEFTLVFDLDIKNNAFVSKDRTNLFSGKPEMKITVNTGRQILDWCQSGLNNDVVEVRSIINCCKTIEELKRTYNTYPEYQGILISDYQRRKEEIYEECKSDIVEEEL
jgi:hypothetical protein